LAVNTLLEAEERLMAIGRRRPVNVVTTVINDC